MCVGGCLWTCGVSGENKKRRGGVCVCVWGSVCVGGGAMNLIYFLSPCSPPLSPPLPSQVTCWGWSQASIAHDKGCTRRTISNLRQTWIPSGVLPWEDGRATDSSKLCRETGYLGVPSSCCTVLIWVLFRGTVWRNHYPSTLPLRMLMDLLHSFLYLIGWGRFYWTFFFIPHYPQYTIKC